MAFATIDVTKGITGVTPVVNVELALQALLLVKLDKF